MTAVVIAVSLAILFALWCIDMFRTVYLEKVKIDVLLSETNTDIQVYNEAVAHYNKVITGYPTKIFAGILRYKTLEPNKKTHT